MEQARQGVKQIDPKLAERMGLEDVLEAAQSRVDDLSRALEAGDFSEALEQAERSLRAVETLQARLGMEEQLAQRYPGFVRDPDVRRLDTAGVHGASVADSSRPEAAPPPRHRHSDAGLSPHAAKRRGQPARTSLDRHR